MKKYLTIFTAVFLVGLFITGCGKNDSKLAGTWKLTKAIDTITNKEEKLDTDGTLVMEDEKNGYIKYQVNNFKIKVTIINDNTIRIYDVLDENGNIFINKKGEEEYGDSSYELDGKTLVINYSSKNYKLTFEKQ